MFKNEIIETGHNINNLILENLSLIFIMGSCLVLGLILTWITKLNLRVFQGVYLLLGAIFILINYFSDFGIIVPVIALVIGEIVMLLFLGFLGNKLTSKNYAAILFAVGLFPWSLSLTVSIIYPITLVVITIIYSYFKNFLGFKAINESISNPVKAVSKMKKEKLEKFKKKAAINLSVPFLSSTLIIFTIIVFI